MALPILNKHDPSLADARIKGNLPPDLKQMVATIMYDAVSRPGVFGGTIGKRVVITEASVVPKDEEPSRTEARIVCEVKVTEGPSRLLRVVFV